MAGKRAFRWLLATAVCGAALVSAQTPPAQAPAAGTLVESSNEVRFQMDVQVPSGALAAYLPPAGRPTWRRRATRRIATCVSFSSTASASTGPTASRWAKDRIA